MITSTYPQGVVKSARSYNLDPAAIQRREGWNPRFDFGEIKDLEKSILANGVINPIRVKRLGNGVFELIDGDRRLTAVQNLIAKGHAITDGIPCIIEDAKSDDLENLILMFEANSGKSFLPLEEAAAYKRMQDAGMTLKQIVERVGHSHNHIVDTVRLLTAEPEVQQALKDKKIGSTQAKQIAKTSKSSQKQLAEEAAAAAKAPKAGRRKLKAKIEEERANKRATTKAKLKPLDPATLADAEADVKELLAQNLDAVGAKAATFKSLVQGDAGLTAAATYGILLGIQIALGHKHNFKL